MADTSKAVKAIIESKPPATDRFTYLTIIGEFATPEILPTLEEILQDPQLTQDIGWDLVQTLIPIPGSEACLETIARLGNPREVILSVLAVLASLNQSAAFDDDDDQEETLEDVDEKQSPAPSTPKHFVTLLGMLAILHTRIKVKRPSRFLASTLQTVLQAYDPAHAEMTAAVINLVHSLSGRRRPTLPTRKSSLGLSTVADPDRDGDTSRNAPDPEAQEADKADPGDREVQKKLLLSFVSCVLAVYVNANSMSWSPRLLEFYNPKKVVPGRRTALQAFREDEDLLGRDAIVGRLVALSRDLGLSTCSKEFLQQLCKGPIREDPLAGTDDGVSNPDDIQLSTGGSVCLIAYWAFAATVFDADQPRPDLHAFPDHFSLLELFLEDDAQVQINATPGTIEAIIAIGLWLVHNELVLPPSSNAAGKEEAAANFMNYLHLLTLSAVYHPSLPVRNAASELARLVLHADPDPDDRLKILEDLLENCMFGTLKACGVAWLREELISAATTATSTPAPAGATTTAVANNPFRGPDALEAVQYAVFPNLSFLRDMDGTALLDWWVASAPFVLQAVNLALFLFRDGGAYAHAVPDGMGAAVESRYFEPLGWAAGLLEGLAKREVEAGGQDDGVAGGQVGLLMEIEVLRERLGELGRTERFRGVTEATGGGK